MKYNKLSIFLILVISGVLFLLPNFYRNQWKAVDPAYYDEWQIRYDRLVVARLVKNSQDGFFSAGGLLGLGDSMEWNFLSATHRHQYNAYMNHEEFNTYLVYKSNPGFQGLLYGLMDKATGIDEVTKLKIFRSFTALLSAIGFGLMFAAITFEFGIVAGILMVSFSAFSIWSVLPAGSIFWNLWAFYLPYIASTYLLAIVSKTKTYNAQKIHLALFTTTLLRVLLSGFDIITTGMIMTTVPYIYYAIKDGWEWKLFIDRFSKSSIFILLGSLAGLFIMFIQIIINDGNFSNAFKYFEDRFGHHLAGSSKYFLEGNVKATKISITEIVSKYINMPAINLKATENLQIFFWQLIVFFTVCTILFFLVFKIRKGTTYHPKSIALITATWYSMLAPLSWIILFRPHSIIHTHVNTMGWQMPFTLLGFALCGYVITDLFKKEQPTELPLSPASQSD